MKALIVVDVQPDFLPGGALAVNDGDSILPGLGELMRNGSFGLIVATQDWHTPRHVSFASAHPGRAPFETIDLYGRRQTLWPDHCVQNTPGAELLSGMPWERAAAVIRKGSDPDVDSYSGFRNNWNAQGLRPPTGLTGYLRERGVRDVFLGGLARDFCVKWSAEDAANDGFRVHVLWDLTRPVDPSSNENVRESLKQAGVEILDSASLKRS